MGYAKLTLSDNLFLYFSKKEKSLAMTEKGDR
jgi:hypothetical protein